MQNLFFAGLFFIQCGIIFLLATSFIFFIPHYRDYEYLPGPAGSEMMYHVLAEEEMEMEEGLARPTTLSETVFPLSCASVWSLIFFQWVWDLIDIGYRESSVEARARTMHDLIARKLETNRIINRTRPSLCSSPRARNRQATRNG